MGGDNAIVRNIIGGWALSGIFSYTAGTPLLIVSSDCTSPSQGTCMPDIKPEMRHKIRQNGSWGKGITGANLAAVQYLNPAAFSAPQQFPLPPCTNSDPTKCAARVPLTKIGDAPRTSLGLRNPSNYDIDMSLRRSFNITPERVKFLFQADCSNITNKVRFGGIGVNVSASTFGQVTSASGNRDFQFSGRITF